MPRPRTLGECTTCHRADAVAKNECGSCYEYRRRTGRPRPRDLWKRTARLRWERHTRDVEAARLRAAYWQAELDALRRADGEGA